MKYKLNKRDVKLSPLWLLVIVLGILVIFLLNVAYSCSTVARQRQYTQCDEVVYYPDEIVDGKFRQGGKVCEIFLRPSADANKVQEVGVTKEDRL